MNHHCLELSLYSAQADHNYHARLDQSLLVRSRLSEPTFHPKEANSKKASQNQKSRNDNQNAANLEKT
eukprot:6454735-Amphidinium_carterae.5